MKKTTNQFSTLTLSVPRISTGYLESVTITEKHYKKDYKKSRRVYYSLGVSLDTLKRKDSLI